jgi:hypothetical protein
MSAWTSDRFIEDTEKQLERDSQTKYGTYEIIDHKWWDVLKIWTEEKIKEVTLRRITPTNVQIIVLLLKKLLI